MRISDWSSDVCSSDLVQELFGLTRHPSVGEPPVPLVLALTSPAHRPIQTTRDIAGFWGGSWHDVAREMRGRYPKHSWPDDPAAARPRSEERRVGQGCVRTCRYRW